MGIEGASAKGGQRVFDEAAVFPIIRRRWLVEEICGTGSFIGPDSLILTCSHLWESAPGASYLLSLSPYDLRELIEIQWVLIDTDQDLAIGYIGTGEWTAALSISVQMTPEPKAAISVPGFRYLNYRDLQGAYSQTGTKMETISGTYLFHYNELSMPGTTQYGPKRMPVVATVPLLMPGFSGAPVLNASGEIVGVHSNNAYANNGGQSVAFNVRLDAIADTINEVRGHGRGSFLET